MKNLNFFSIFRCMEIRPAFLHVKDRVKNIFFKNGQLVYFDGVKAFIYEKNGEILLFENERVYPEKFLADENHTFVVECQSLSVVTKGDFNEFPILPSKAFYIRASWFDEYLYLGLNVESSSREIIG